MYLQYMYYAPICTDSFYYEKCAQCFVVGLYRQLFAVQLYRIGTTSGCYWGILKPIHAYMYALCKAMYKKYISDLCHQEVGRMKNHSKARYTVYLLLVFGHNVLIYIQIHANTFTITKWLYIPRWTRGFRPHFQIAVASWCSGPHHLCHNGFVCVRACAPVFILCDMCKIVHRNIVD